MTDRLSEFSRRDFLKAAGTATVLGLGGAYLARNRATADRLVEQLKTVAESIRLLPGLGYSGEAVPLRERFGGRDLLSADRDRPGFWKGAPSMESDDANDRTLVHVRHRTPKHRGHRVSIYEFDPANWDLTELVAVNKDDIGARSMEGGDVIRRNGEFRWFISYQSDREGDWRIQERRAATVGALDSGGEDLGIASNYYHNKDPVVINGDLYVAASSRTWLDQGIERIDVDSETPEAEELDVGGTGNARVTSGGLLDDEVFVDFLPDLPYTNVPNFLWTSDERSSTGRIQNDAVSFDRSRHFVSPDYSSVTYVDVETVGESVCMLWQEEKPDGSNDLVGTRIGIEDYGELF